MNENEKLLQQDQRDQERLRLELEINSRLDAMRREVAEAKKYTNCANLLGQINQELGIDMFHEPAENTLKMVQSLKSDVEHWQSEYDGAKRQIIHRGEKIDELILERTRLTNRSALWQRRAVTWFWVVWIQLAMTIGYCILVWNIHNH